MYTLCLAIVLGGLSVRACELPVRYDGMALFLTVRLGQADCRLLVDTGSPHTFLDPAASRKTGLPFAYRQFVYGTVVNGYSAAETSLSAGPVELGVTLLRRETATVNAKLKASGSEPCDGVLGSDFALRHGVLIDLRRKVMCVEKLFLFGGQLAAPARVEAARPSRAPLRLPRCFTRLNGTAQVRPGVPRHSGEGIIAQLLPLAIVLGGMSERWAQLPLEADGMYVFVSPAIGPSRCRLLLDTGASLNLIDPPSAGRRGIRFSPVVVRSAGQEVKQRMAEATVTVGSLLFEVSLVRRSLGDVNLDLRMFSREPCEGILGIDFLMRHGARIDFRTRQLLLRKVYLFGKQFG